MISYDNENLASKDNNEDAVTEPLNPDSTDLEKGLPASQDETNQAGLFNTQFQQKTKMLREMWSQHKVKLHKDNTKLVGIVVLTVIAIGCSLAALTTNSWMCDGQSRNYGLWSTCYYPQSTDLLAKIVNASSTANNTGSLIKQTGIMCAKQGFYEVKVEYAEASRMDQVSASQGLIIAGTVLYAFSVVTIALSYKFINVNNMNSVRNALVTSIFIQIISFIFQSIGFFLFISTDRISTSIGILFGYFGIAILATNLINFITIEYKSYKIRQISI